VSSLIFINLNLRACFWSVIRKTFLNRNRSYVASRRNEHLHKFKILNLWRKFRKNRRYVVEDTTVEEKDAVEETKVENMAHDPISMEKIAKKMLKLLKLFI